MQTLDQAIEILSTNQVNLQLDFSQDKDGYLLYQIRLLPWRNNARQGYMILVADHTITNALCIAADDLQHDRWAVLNWKVALNEPGRYFGYGGIGMIKSASTNGTIVSNAPQDPVKLYPIDEGLKPS